MSDRSLDSLSPAFKPLAVLFLARLVEANIAVMIINTRRTAAEQADNVARGVSWVEHSKHQDGDAIDVCPYAVYNETGGNKLNWSDEDPTWLKIGKIAEACGLRWGGRWVSTPDWGHVERIT